ARRRVARVARGTARRLVPCDAGQVPRADADDARRARRRAPDVSLVQSDRNRARRCGARGGRRVRPTAAPRQCRHGGATLRDAARRGPRRRRRPAGAVAPASARCARRNDHPGRHAAAVVAARRLRRARSGEARRARRRCVARGRGDASRRAAPRRLTAGGVIVQTFLSYGFRPFFLLAAAWAVLALVLLVVALAGGGWSAEALPLYRWHGHEMIFGFVAAAIAGFLLTAAPTWTSTRPVSGT